MHTNSVEFLWGLSASSLSKLPIFPFAFFSSFPSGDSSSGNSLLHKPDRLPLWETKAKSHEEILLLKVAVFEIFESLQLLSVRVQPLQASILALQTF